MKKIATTLIIAATLTSCYKAKLNETNHPTQVAVEVTIPTPTQPDGSPIEGDLTLLYDGVEYDVNGGDTQEIPYLLDPGTHTYYTYSTTSNSATITYDESTGAIIAEVPMSGGVVESTPDYVYFGSETVELTKDSDVVLSTTLTSVICDLSFTLALSGDAIDELTSFSASLNGVAQQWDCINDEPYGTSASVEQTLSKTTLATASLSRASGSTYYLEGTIRLLGVFGEETQTLKIELGYEGANPATHIFEHDVTSLLADFNDDKTVAKGISATVETPTESNPSGTITDWVTTQKEVVAE